MGRIFALVIGYCFGLFQSGYFYGKLKHVDIREHGSGNAGATNALRTFGVKGGLITFLGDLSKGILAILLTWALFREQWPGEVALFELYAGAGVILGHNFPFYLHFRGGKGIACTAALIVALSPRLHLILIPLALFILIVAVTRYVSLGSLMVAVAFFVNMVYMGSSGALGLGGNLLTEYYAVSGAISALAFWKHRENIRRLLQGTERKVGSKKE